MCLLKIDLLMRNLNPFLLSCFLFFSAGGNNFANCQIALTVEPRYKVTLPKAHIGSLEVDTMLLNSYELMPSNVRQFYLDARAVFSSKADANFTDAKIIEAAQRNRQSLISGPMLGNLSDKGVVVWLRSATSNTLTILVKKDGSNGKRFLLKGATPGAEQKIVLDGLLPNTDYEYVILDKKRPIAKGRFKTAPSAKQQGLFHLAFGSDFHKIGLHNPNLINQILKVKPSVMMLLGDGAVDDRDSNINMHRSDYLLRDVAKSWQQLASNIPLYAAWDDHDYMNDDLSGIPKGFTEKHRHALRAIWKQNWNNPHTEFKGIYFNARTGPVEMFMLDTRSYRDNNHRGQYGSFLGSEQLAWLKEALKNSTAPFKLISSGTMWSDNISNGKDSWGTWDTQAREEILSFIETNKIAGVILLSGDRHGARGFKIERPSGHIFYEFEAGTLGGVPGPEAVAKNSSNQLFGYAGLDTIAFGELVFDSNGEKPSVTFRLIDEKGATLEKHSLSYQQLTPGK